ncbi:hypothetical protein [Paenibacillus cremeus]|uniref:Uncharacterized protein n=1 Tax=Paenibacillus cremeus TaxID=2163881 RepID=A0A559JM89_9BACL|nr:hypothetical protein [Paenibacillus cremeus]TVY00993.1 hypothetical protein FPZ49_32900 [Paenibacillus cremeus]
MNTPIAKILTETFDLTEDEKVFISSLDREAYTPEAVYRVSAILTDMYTAKIHERAAQQSAEFAKLNELAAIESSKSSKVITKLTWVLMIASVVQAIATGIQAYAAYFALK